MRWNAACTLALALTGPGLLGTLAAMPRDDSGAAMELFETAVRPLFAEHCFSCHGPDRQAAGLRLDTREGFRKGAASGPVVDGSDPARSRLVRAVRHEGRVRMPPAGKLRESEIAALERWVRLGAPWTEARAQAPTARGFQPTPAQRRFWSFQPIRRPVVPGDHGSRPAGLRSGSASSRGFGAEAASLRSASADFHKTGQKRLLPRASTSPVNPIDAFILAKLREKGLRPAPRADRRTLIRRASFDLLGLPPTPEEVEAFVNDRSPDAWRKVVDRLLASPHYGERWGRHWLDVVRYCDSLDSRVVGQEADISEAWRYRDWVVNALNSDMPYSDFILYQVAGDIVAETAADEPRPVHERRLAGGGPAVQVGGARITESQARAGSPRIASADPRNPLPNSPPIRASRTAPGGFNPDAIVATGLLAIGNWGNGDADKEKILTDMADDMVDVTARAFLGLTLSCARCHHHKFDPLSTEDYYGLAGIFFSTHILPKLTPKGQGEVMLRIPLISKAEQARRADLAARTAQAQQRLQAERERRYAAHARTLLPETARYVAAAWESSRSQEPPEVFARSRGLAPCALRQWRDFLGYGDYRLMSTPVREVLGSAGVHAWKGAGDTPSATINTTGEARSLLTFTLPARSVSVHPGPANGVVAAWRSPVSGPITLAGRVADSDAAGGDGVAWIVDHRTGGLSRELASGKVPNGGAQDLSAGQGAERLVRVEVRQGDEVQLLVLPGEAHTCDTTTVELRITGPDGRTWDLSRDLADDPLEGNPHADGFGNPAVWAFYDMAASRRARKDPPAAGTPLAALLQALESGDGQRVDAAARAFAAGFTVADPSSPFWIRDAADESALPDGDRTELARLAQDLDDLRRQAPPPPAYANGAKEGGVPESTHAGVHDVRVHIRGRYDRLGEVVPRRFPLLLAGDRQPPIREGSGRLQLARWLASPSNPLTARVIVNRLWQHHFGEGIVRTPSNFGFLGDRPSHPELLDWLAAELVNPTADARVCGCAGARTPRESPSHPHAHAPAPWSLKRMHRLILLSETYQQSSVGRPETVRADPDNRLFGRMNRRRLEAEPLRDSLLAVSGRLDRTMGGPAVRDAAAPRRALYIMTIRSNREGFGPLFDQADPTSSVDRRTVSTVAPQALFMLNNPFVLEQAKALARRLLAMPGTDTDRIAGAYALLYARPPRPAEVEVARKLLASQGAGRRPSGGSPGAGQAAWERWAQVLLCANEFLYID